MAAPLSAPIAPGIQGAPEVTALPNNGGAAPAPAPVTSSSAQQESPVTTEPSVLSSATGAQIVQTQAQKMSALGSTQTPPVKTPVVQTPATDTQTTQTTNTSNTGTATQPVGGQTQTPPATKVTLINPTTGQTLTFTNPDANQDSIQGYLKSGFSLSDAEGDIPDWLTSGSSSSSDASDTDPATAADQQAISDASDQLTTLTNNLSNYTVSDSQLASTVAGITQQWQQRINDMNTINAQRVSALNTLGIRLGSRYSGGSGGNFGGIVTAEEQQGVQRIGDLQAQMQAAITAAQTAAQTQNWTVYSKQVDLAQSAYEDKVKALNDLQTQTAAQNKVISDAIEQQKTDLYNQVQKPIDDIATTAASNGASPSVLAAIQAAPDVTSAITAAGDSLQTMTGDLADYKEYSDQASASGQIPESYQTWKDAQTYNTAYTTALADARGKADGTPAAPGSNDTSPVTSPIGLVYNVPAAIAPYANFASNGTKYVDLSSFAGTASEKNDAVNQAQAAGYKVITNANTALDLKNIQNAQSNLQDMQDAFDPDAPDNAIDRDTYAAGLESLDSYLQTGNEASLTVYGDTALDVLKAISGVQGFRGGAAAIANVKETLPQIGDSQTIVNGKIANIQKLISNRETALVGAPSPSDQLLVQGAQATQTVNTYVSSHPDQANNISAMYNVPGTTDATVAAYLQQAGLLNAPAQTQTVPNPFKNGLSSL